MKALSRTLWLIPGSLAFTTSVWSWCIGVRYGRNSQFFWSISSLGFCGDEFLDGLRIGPLGPRDDRRRRRRRPWSRDRRPARASRSSWSVAQTFGILLGLPLLLEHLDRRDLVAAPDQPSLDGPILGTGRPRRPSAAAIGGEAFAAAATGQPDRQGRNGQEESATVPANGGTDGRPHGVSPRSESERSTGRSGMSVPGGRSGGPTSPVAGPGSVKPERAAHGIPRRIIPQPARHREAISRQPRRARATGWSRRSRRARAEGSGPSIDGPAHRAQPRHGSERSLT